MKPLARREGLVARGIRDEVVVYDLESHRAHSLNVTAARVFERCDGTRTVPDLARLAGTGGDVSADEALVWEALEQLSAADLLKHPAELPPAAPPHSRREMLRRAGIAAALLPVVSSIVAPTPAEAAASGCVYFTGSNCENGRPCDCVDGTICDGTCSGTTTCAGGSGC